MTPTPINQPSPGQGERPTFTVIRGDATDDELAALLAVLATKLSAADRPGTRRRSTSVWNDRASGLRRPLQIGPSSWRASAWQR